MEKTELFLKTVSLGFFVLAIISGSFSLDATFDGYFMAPTMAFAGFLSRLMEISQYFYWLTVLAFIVLISGLIHAKVISFADVERGAYWVVLFFASGAFSLVAAIVIGAVMIALGIRAYGMFLFLGAFVFVFSTEFLGIFKKLLVK